MRTLNRSSVTLGLAAALTLAGSSQATAQRGSGDGFLYHEPEATFSFRLGYAQPRAGSDVFDFTEGLLTLKKSSFAGFNSGAEVAFSLASHFEATLDAGFSYSRPQSEYRNFVDNNNLPIQQTTLFARVPLTANFRAYLVEPGRSVGHLAWIPNKIVPWVGAGAGTMWYSFTQHGDFIMDDNSVQTRIYEATGWTPVIQGMGGVDFNLTPSVALRADARYLWANSDLSTDFSGFNPIDLSGASMTLGLTFRM